LPLISFNVKSGAGFPTTAGVEGVEVGLSSVVLQLQLAINRPEIRIIAAKITDSLLFINSP
jgi:hypothetical protein